MGTYHVSNLISFDKNPAYQLLNPSTPLISHISDNNLVVGAYKDKENPSKYYFLIVNKSLKPVNNIDLFFKGAGPANLIKFASNNTNNPLQNQQLALTYFSKLNKAKTTLEYIEGGGMVVLEATVPANMPLASRVGGFSNETNGLSISTIPNPVKDGALIRYSINKPGPITVKVYNLVGQEVKSLVEEEKIHEGEYFINFNTTGLGVGVYTCVLVTKDGKVATKILKVPG